MSTTTLQPGKSPVVMFSSDTKGDTFAPRMEFKDSGEGRRVLAMSNVAVFRSGTFRDSWGDQVTYEGIHIDQMVMNFDLLSSRGVFADVPVRDGHPGFLVSGQEGNGRLVGYVTSLSAVPRTNPVDGQEYTYLLAEYDIIDPAAQEAIASGLWRNRSAEVGPFFANDDSMFYPTFLGFAYVDIPAVQGLAFSKQDSSNTTRYIFEEESMSKFSAPVATDQKVETPAPVAPSIPPVPTAPVAVEDAPVAVEEDATDAPAPDATVPPTTAHAAPTPSASAFRINGVESRDFSAVQAHIDALEQYRSESIAAARENFVNGLMSEGKIFAAQLEPYKAFAAGLSDKDFAEWKGLFADAPANPVLGKFGAATPTADTASAAGADAERVGILKETIRGHVYSNIAASSIEGMASYKELKSLVPDFDLSSLK